MAMTGTITASATTVAAGEATQFTITVSNSGGGAVFVSRIEPTILPLDASVRVSNGWPRRPIQVEASGSQAFTFTAVGHKAEPTVVQSPFSFVAHFAVVCDDGTRIELDSPYVLVGSQNDGVLGVARFDGPMTQLAPVLFGG